MHLKYPGELLREWLQKRSITPDEEEFGDFRHIIDTVFFASLATEEGDPVLVDVVIGGAKELSLRRDTDLGPEEAEDRELAWTVMPISPRTFSVSELAKLAPGLKAGRSAVVLGSASNGQPCIEAVAVRNPRTSVGGVFMVAATGPGVIRLSQDGEELVTFERGVLRNPVRNVILANSVIRTAIDGLCPRLRTKKILGSSPDAPRVLAEMVDEIRRAGRGGMILLLDRDPSREECERTKYLFEDKEVLFRAVSSSARKSDAWLAQAFSHDPEDSTSELMYREAQNARADALYVARHIARLGSTDNALLLGRDLFVYGAGFAVPTDDELKDVYIASDPNGVALEPYDLSRNGSRHRAAASFVNANKTSLAILISEDGPAKAWINASDRITFWDLPPLRSH